MRQVHMRRKHRADGVALEVPTTPATWWADGVETSEGWELRVVVPEGRRVAIAGVDPWQVEWEPMLVGSVVVVDPMYPGQRHTIGVYQLTGVEPAVFFAAGEFSICVWGFPSPWSRCASWTRSCRTSSSIPAKSWSKNTKATTVSPT